MSEIIIWDQKYSVGIELIDHQHQRLFGYLNVYYDSLIMTTSEVNGVADDLVKSTLNHLTEYASYHFCEEEKIMNSIKGFDFSQHFKEHQDFCLKVAELKTKVFLGDNIAYELFDFIKDWVLTHILLTDKKIGDAYNKNR